MNGQMHSRNGALSFSRRPWRAFSAQHDRYALDAHRKRKAIPHTLFVITLVATFALGWALYDVSTKAHQSSAWVAHTNDMLNEISAVEQHLTRAHSGMHGYLVTGNSSFLMERDSALSALDDRIDELARLTAYNPQQQARTEALRELIAKRVALMGETMKRYQSTGGRGTAGTERARQQATDSILSAAREMRKVERDLLDLRRQHESARHERTTMLLTVAAILAALIVVPAYFAFIQQSRARARVERRLYEMADSVPGVVYQYRYRPDGASRYEFLSTGVEAYGIEREAALEDPAVIANMICDGDRPAVTAAIAGAADTLIPIEYEYRIKLAGGGIRWVHSSAAPRKQADGSILWNGHWADITEQKRLQHALQEARAAADSASGAKSIFLAVMSHEIRTPLNGILGMLELISLTALDAEQRSTLNVVRESSSTLQRIIDDILDFSKIEAGKLEIAVEPVSVRAVVETTRDTYSGNASSKGLLLESTVDPRVSPALVVDPLRLRQILNNLVSNAIKFTPRGLICISADFKERSGTEETIRFTVADSGIGMSPEVLAKIFQPFSQGGAATARTFGGTGLGLTISQRLAAIMGGTIEVESEPGKGTRMILTLTLPVADLKDLPAADAVAQPALSRVPLAPVRTAPSVEAAVLERTLVLIADDHPVNRMLLGRQVKLLGYAAEIVENGVEALAKWRSGRFATLITDVNMPEMDGYELARRIRNEEAGTRAARVPIIACTANAMRGDAETALEAGMDDYLPKPVQLAELQQKLQQWLPLPEPEAARTQVSETPTEVRDDDGEVFDRSALAELAGDPAAEAEILTEFQHANRHDAASLQQAVQRSDLAEVKTAAHRMKGASRMVGMSALAAACERVEQAGHARDLEAVKDGVGALVLELVRADECIRRHATASGT